MKRALTRYFFSRRRRHTRYWRDWSSDVCSSDLRSYFSHAAITHPANDGLREEFSTAWDIVRKQPAEIGRASCRERVKNHDVTATPYKTPIEIVVPAWIESAVICTSVDRRTALVS